ncbi:MAG: extracellular solute-binding protein, partial [Firmicutes bacterium]|nr:extracellular solute-binding protein [Bacillota bacterium]
MKKRIALFLSLFLMTVPIVGAVACSARDNVLKLYNWQDYMADGVVSGFEQYYLQKTGKKIRVEVSNFATNEEAYAQIKTKKEDYDVFIPSDYMIDRMRNEDLLLALDKNILLEGATDTNGDGVVNEQDIFDKNIMEIVKDAFDPDLAYSVPYLWGTVGILYDPTRGDTRVTDADAHTWESLFGDKFAGSIYMKNSVHDAFTIGSVYANFEDVLKPLLGTDANGQTQQEIVYPDGSQGVTYAYTEAYKERLRKVITDTADDNIERVREV